MDVYLQDEDKVINMEMQTANHGDLAKRARYYQAAADIDTTPKGSRYRELRQNYVIFICKHDYTRKKPAQTDFTRELGTSISKLKQEKEERSMYLTYTSRMMECRQDGYQEGISIGLERGAYQNKLETAKSMLSLGLPLD